MCTEAYLKSLGPSCLTLMHNIIIEVNDDLHYRFAAHPLTQAIHGSPVCSKKGCVRELERGKGEERYKVNYSNIKRSHTM